MGRGGGRDGGIYSGGEFSLKEGKKRAAQLHVTTTKHNFKFSASNCMGSQIQQVSSISRFVC
jgi:hypothetical protein